MKLNEDIIDSEKKKLVTELLNNEISDKKIYILGRNNNAIELSKLISVDAYIDDFTKENSFLSKPIIKSSALESNTIVISCSLAIYPLSAKKTLKEKNLEGILDCLEFSKYSDNIYTIDFIDKCCNDLKVNIDYYEDIYNRMTDTKSQCTFIDILNFRKNRELSYLENYIVDEKGQYFEDFLNLQDGEVFVDAGGYDGQTSVEFIKYCPNYKSVYIFEPDSENLNLAKENLKNFKNINFISKGLSNKKDILRFDTGSGSASSISENGNVEIEVDTLDNLVDEKVTFIKMDIEGAEGLAIDGMKKHILEDHPKMAISVYHKVDDFWKIPKQILTIRDDYDLYMRHYTEGTDETVMFFMPKKDF